MLNAQHYIHISYIEGPNSPINLILPYNHQSTTFTPRYLKSTIKSQVKSQFLTLTNLQYCLHQEHQIDNFLLIICCNALNVRIFPRPPTFHARAFMTCDRVFGIDLIRCLGKLVTIIRDALFTSLHFQLGPH